jgi:hypothetical protein
MSRNNALEEVEAQLTVLLQMQLIKFHFLGGNSRELNCSQKSQAQSPSAACLEALEMKEVHTASRVLLEVTLFLTLQEFQEVAAMHGGLCCQCPCSSRENAGRRPARALEDPRAWGCYSSFVGGGKP